MIREYLIKNQELVNKKLIEKKELLEHNKIVIEEADLKIEELNSIVDEATEMFSIKGREDSEFHQKEIRKIQLKNIEVMNQNEEIIKEIDLLQKELK